MMVPGLPQWPGVKTLPSNMGSVGSILGQGTKIPHVVECGLTLKKKNIAVGLQSQLLTAGVAATIKRPGPAHSPVTPSAFGLSAQQYRGASCDCDVLSLHTFSSGQKNPQVHLF